MEGSEETGDGSVKVVVAMDGWKWWKSVGISFRRVVKGAGGYIGLPRATHARAFHASDTTSSFAEAPKAGVGPSDISAVTDNTMALIRRTVKRVKRYPRPRRRWMAGPERVGLRLSYRISFELRRIEQLFDSGAHCSFDPLSLSSRDPDLLLMILPFILHLHCLFILMTLWRNVNFSVSIFLTTLSKFYFLFVRFLDKNNESKYSNRF